MYAAEDGVNFFVGGAPVSPAFHNAGIVPVDDDVGRLAFVV